MGEAQGGVVVGEAAALWHEGTVASREGGTLLLGKGP